MVTYQVKTIYFDADYWFDYHIIKRTFFSPCFGTLVFLQSLIRVLLKQMKLFGWESSFRLECILDLIFGSLMCWCEALLLSCCSFFFLFFSWARYWSIISFLSWSSRILPRTVFGRSGDRSTYSTKHVSEWNIFAKFGLATIEF